MWTFIQNVRRLWAEWRTRRQARRDGIVSDISQDLRKLGVR